MNSKPNRPRAVTIAGPGRVGNALHVAAQRAGIESRLIGREELAAGQFGPTPELGVEPMSPMGIEPSAFESGDGDSLVLLAVPDSEIVNACAQICAGGAPPGPVGHLSGATPLAALSKASESGAGIFSLHPLQTFSGKEPQLDGVPCALTASDPSTNSLVQEFALALGMRPFTLAEEDRAAYHAAACIASNFLVALEEKAAQLIERVGVPQGREMLAPLVTQSLNNWIERGGSALTGPIARGDSGTVARHLEALAEIAPEMLEPYRVLAEMTESIADSAQTKSEVAAG